jgi:hypothetical protein
MDSFISIRLYATIAFIISARFDSYGPKDSAIPVPSAVAY